MHNTRAESMAHACAPNWCIRGMHLGHMTGARRARACSAPGSGPGGGSFAGTSRGGARVKPKGRTRGPDLKLKK